MINVPSEIEAEGGASEESDQVISFLRDRDAPCPLCGYNLRGLASGRCPECGSGLRLAVGLAEPFLRAWIAVVVSFVAGAGLGIFFVVMLLSHGPPSRESPGLYVAMIYFILSIPAAAVSLVTRRNFLRLGRATQIRMAVVIAVATIVIFVLFFWTVR